jgi:hypothetical protein
LAFDHPAQQIAFQDYVDAVMDAEQRLQRVEEQIFSLLHILAKGDEETTGFTDYGIECLKQIIQVKKTRPSPQPVCRADAVIQVL